MAMDHPLIPVGVGTKYMDSLPSEKEWTINNQYSYTTTFGETEYIVIVKESDTAKETITKKLERVISSDVSKSVFSEGEAVWKDNQRLNITIPIWEVIP